jgi:hypothetical protein
LAFKTTALSLSDNQPFHFSPRRGVLKMNTAGTLTSRGSALLVRALLSLECVALLLVFTASAAAQSATGAILGTVTDETGAVTPGVTVVVTLTETNQSRATVTNDSGEYIVPLLPAGTYLVRGERTGFKSVSRGNIVLQVDQRARVDFVLEVGDVSEIVTVDMEPPVIQTDSGSVGQVVNEREMVRLPLNGRNFMQLTLLTPGVVDANDLRQSTMGISPTANGVRSEYNNYILDGTTNTEHENTAVVSVPPLDSLQEFKLQSANYSAEFGQGGGAVLNIITKSGTNEFHGNVWEFIRNEKLDARNFFAVDRPPLKRNQFGGTLGGPIIRNKTFFFGAYEGLRERRGVTLVRRVPTAAELNGDFSNSLGAAPRDPLTGATLATRMPFPGGIIPPERIDPISKAIAQNFPAPNNPEDPLRNNIVNGSLRTDDNNYSVRIDHHLTDRDTIFGRYNRNNSNGVSPGGWPTCCDDLRTSRNQQLGLGYTHMFGPNLINEFKFGANGYLTRNEDTTQGTDVGADLGILGLPDYEGAKHYPTMSMTGYNIPTGIRFGFVENNTLVWSDNLSYVVNNHSLKMGVEVSRFSFNDLFAPGAPITMSFTGLLTGNALADFLLGRHTSSQVNYRQPFIENRISLLEAYFHDDWSFSRKLTINYGVRFTTQAPTTEKQDEQSGINLVTGASLIPQNADIGTFQGRVERIDSRGLIKRDTKFAPRLSFAYRPFENNKTVLRGGYGIFTALEQGNATRQPGTNPPFSIRNSVTDNTNGLTYNGPTSGRLTLDQVAAGITAGFGAQFIDPDFQNGYVQTWNLTAERELLADLALSVGYVGSKGTHLSRLVNFNDPSPRGPGPVQPRRPYQEFGGITLIQSASNSTYHALQARLQRRYTAGLTALIGYTWSKALGDNATLNQGGIQDPECDRCEKGRTDFDVKHRFVASFSYELPFGNGKPFFANNGFASAVLGGWILSGIVQLQTGYPLTIGNNDIANVGRGGNRPDLVGDPRPANQTLDEWILRSAFANPAPFNFGSAGNGIIDGPGRQEFDASLIREFPMWEGTRLAFHADFFNVFNHANFGNPNVNFAAAAFGRISSARDPRNLQFGLKFYF